MDFEFRSQEELFKRVRPALHAKETELHRLGYIEITSIDIWKYLVQKKWISAQGLMLSDIVSDIINADCKNIFFYWKSTLQNQKKEHVQEDREIL